MFRLTEYMYMYIWVSFFKLEQKNSLSHRHSLRASSTNYKKTEKYTKTNANTSLSRWVNWASMHATVCVSLATEGKATPNIDIQTV